MSEDTNKTTEDFFFFFSLWRIENKFVASITKGCLHVCILFVINCVGWQFDFQGLNNPSEISLGDSKGNICGVETDSLDSDGLGYSLWYLYSNSIKSWRIHDVVLKSYSCFILLHWHLFLALHLLVPTFHQHPLYSTHLLTFISQLSRPLSLLLFLLPFLSPSFPSHLFLSIAPSKSRGYKYLSAWRRLISRGISN